MSHLALRAHNVIPGVTICAEADETHLATLWTVTKVVRSSDVEMVDLVLREVTPRRIPPRFAGLYPPAATIEPRVIKMDVNFEHVFKVVGIILNPGDPEDNDYGSAHS